MEQETSIRSSSTAQDDAPPPPIIDQGSGDAATVRYLQTLLVERFGYQIAIDGDFGPATAAAVQSFKQSNNLGGNTEVDGDTWRALQTADAQSSILTGRGMSPMSNEIHLAGRWTDGSPRSAAISVTLTIDMSAWGRPTAHGSVLDGSTISVTFPDDATYTGTLLPPDMIRWSNGSIWQRVDLGKAEGGE